MARNCSCGKLIPAAVPGGSRGPPGRPAAPAASRGGLLDRQLVTVTNAPGQRTVQRMADLSRSRPGGRPGRLVQPYSRKYSKARDRLAVFRYCGRVARVPQSGGGRCSGASPRTTSRPRHPAERTPGPGQSSPADAPHPPTQPGQRPAPTNPALGGWAAGGESGLGGDQHSGSRDGARVAAQAGKGCARGWAARRGRATAACRAVRRPCAARGAGRWAASGGTAWQQTRPGRERPAGRGHARPKPAEREVLAARRCRPPAHRGRSPSRRPRSAGPSEAGHRDLGQRHHRRGA